MIPTQDAPYPQLLDTARGPSQPESPDSDFTPMWSSTDSQSSEFLEVTPKIPDTKLKINRWDCIKLKSFGIAKLTISEMKRQPTEYTKYMSDKWLNIQNIQGIHMTQQPEHPNNPV